MDGLNYHHLLNFWLVAREGSVQRASEVLQVTPASVSLQVRQLERALGVRLLTKRGRGVAVTEMGQQVADYATDIFAKGRELLEVVRGRPAGRPLPLRVGIRDVMPKLVAFRLLRPALEMGTSTRLVCQEGEMGRLVADLAIHKLDLVLSDVPLDPLYKVSAYSHLLGESAVVVVGTPALREKYRSGFPQSLQGAPFLLPTDNSMVARLLVQWFSEQRVRPWIAGEFADSAMLKIAGSHGLGLFAISTGILEEVRAMYHVEVVGEIPEIHERYYAISVERKVKHPAVVAIREGRSRA